MPGNWKLEDYTSLDEYKELAQRLTTDDVRALEKALSDIANVPFDDIAYFRLQWVVTVSMREHLIGNRKKTYSMPDDNIRTKQEEKDPEIDSVAMEILQAQKQQGIPAMKQPLTDDDLRLLALCIQSPYDHLHQAVVAIVADSLRGDIIKRAKEQKSL